MSKELRKNQTTTWIVVGIAAIVVLVGCLFVVVLGAVGYFVSARSTHVSQVSSGPVLPPPAAVYLDEPTVTPYIVLAPTEPSASGQGSPGSVVLANTHLDIAQVLLDRGFPAGCTGNPPACTTAQDGYQFLSILLMPVDLPEGQMLPYKNILGEVVVEINTSEKIPLTVQMYDNATRNLTIGFEVPESATLFTLQWPGSDAIALSIDR